MASPIALLKRTAGLIVGELIMLCAHALTGMRALWRGSVPSTAQRVYFGNHGSHGDFVLIWTTLPGPFRKRTRPVAGLDYWSASALRRFVITEVFNGLLIDRKPEPGAPSPVDAMAESLRRGDSLIMFPEGTRNTGDTPLLPFKSGLFHLSRACPQVELIPVWIDNIKRVIPKGHWLPVPMICSVSYGPALSFDPEEQKEAFLRRAEAAVLALRPQESIT